MNAPLDSVNGVSVNRSMTVEIISKAVKAGKHTACNKTVPWCGFMSCSWEIPS